LALAFFSVRRSMCWSGSQPRLGITAAPLVIKDRIIVGASLGDLGLRHWIAGLDAATSKKLWAPIYRSRSR
jgi:hypothetical protein